MTGQRESSCDYGTMRESQKEDAWRGHPEGQRLIRYNDNDDDDAAPDPNDKGVVGDQCPRSRAALSFTVAAS